MDKQYDIEKISDKINRERKMNSDFGDDDLGMNFFAHLEEIQKRIHNDENENEQKQIENKWLKFFPKQNLLRIFLIRENHIYI